MTAGGVSLAALEFFKVMPEPEHPIRRACFYLMQNGGEKGAYGSLYGKVLREEARGVQYVHAGLQKTIFFMAI